MLRILPDDMSETMSEFSGVRVGSTRSFFFPRLVWHDLNAAILAQLVRPFSQDLNGRELVGGLHNWVKFYLEERRGAARYLGPRYKGTGKHDAALNPYFVSGKFTWDLDGKHLATCFTSMFKRSFIYKQSAVKKM